MTKDFQSMNRWIFIFLTCAGLSSWAQHPFYLQIFEEGKLAMATENWRQAAQDLEIAAFGFLEKEPLLAEAYVRLVLTHKALAHEKETQAFLLDANRVLEKYPNKPAGLSAENWDAFLVTSGRKAPPVPPIPATEGELATYVQRYPENAQAWIALIDSQLVRARPGKLRETFASAMGAHPEHAGILSKALIFSMNQDKGRNSEALATKLIILKPDAPLANEVLGGIAAEKGAWEQAETHFQSVPTPLFPKTSDYQRRIQTQREKQRQAQVEAREREEKRREAAVEAQKQEAESKEQTKADAPNETAGNRASEFPEQRKIDPSLSIENQPDEEATQLVETTRITPEKQPATMDANTPQVISDPTIDERVAQLEKQVKQDAGNPDHKFDLVNAYIDQGSLRKAKKTLAKLARRYNNNPRYAETYAHYQYAQGSYQVNVDNLVGFENNLKGPSAYYLGMSYYRLGQLPKAKAILQRLDASQYDIPQEITGKTPIASSDGGGFEKQITTVSRLSKKEAVEWLDKQANQGNWNDVNRGLGEIIAKYPTDQNIRFYQGRSLMAKGAYDEAMPVFIELVGEGYEDNDIFYYAGLAALEKGDMSVATYLLERAQAKKSPFSSEIQVLLDTRVKSKQ